MQILLGIGHGERCIDRGAFSVEIQPDQRLVSQQEYQQSADETGGAEPQLDAECTLKAVQIALSVILCAVDARSGECAENGEVEHEDQLSGNGNGGHCLGSLAAHHNVVHQAHHIGDAVLDHHGDSQHQRPFVDRIVFSHVVCPSCDVKNSGAGDKVFWGIFAIIITKAIVHF